MTGRLVRLIVDAARREAMEPSAEDLADAFWLARQMSRSTPRPATVVSPGPAADAGTGPPTQPPRPEPGPTPPSASDPPAAQPSPPLNVEFRQPLLDGTTLAEPSVPFRIPDPPAVAARLQLERALRPLKRRVPARRATELDERATADRSADAGRLWPVFKPRPDRWLEVAVVVDDAPSMAVSLRTVDDLVTILSGLGAFRDVRVWHFNADITNERLSLRSGAGTSARDPLELVDPSGRRAMLVVSDCVGAAWWDGQMAGVLARWSQAAPVAVVQPLPQRMWDDVGPQLRSVALRTDEPGSANVRLQVEARDADARDGVAVPVLELGERWLRTWAGLVAGRDGHWVRSKVLVTGLPNVREQQSPSGGEPVSPSAMVREFGAVASADAYAYAAYLSAAAPLSLPVMRLVLRTMLPEAAPSVLHEVFLSGLLERVDALDQSLPADQLQYDFRPGVRRWLLGQLTRQEALSVLLDVARYVVATLGGSVDFLAVLAAEAPELPDEFDSDSRAFARAAIDVLKAVGGVYKDRAERLQEILDRPIVDINAFTSVTEDAKVSSRAQGYPISGRVVTDPGTQVSTRLDRVLGPQPVGWRTVPPRNDNFVGREDMLEDLRQLLVNRSQTAVLLPRALYGLGGVGKTQVATQYAHLHRGDYDLIWWTSAEDPAEVRRSLVELASEMKLPESGDTAETIRRVLDSLSRRSPYGQWLIVFDNAGDPTSLSGLVPELRSGHVLITSRDQAWAGEGRSVAVDVFGREESLALLRARSVAIGAEDASLLADRLGGLPISLAQAAAWHVETKLPVSEYLRRFDEQVGRRPPETLPEGYPPYAAAAMSLAFEQLTSNTASTAADLLRISSYFGPEWISLDLLRRGRFAAGLSSKLGRTLRDLALLQRTTAEIGRLELARYDTRSDRFQIHRLVQALIQLEMEPTERASSRSTVQLMLAQANPGDPGRISDQEARKHQELSAHILPSGIIEAEDEDARQVVLDQIRYRYLVGDFESSHQLATDAVNDWRERWGDQDYLTLVARGHLARAKRELGDVADALSMAEDVVELARRTSGDDDELTWESVNLLTSLFRSVGRFREALRQDEENYNRQVERLGPDDRSTLRAANNLGVDLRLLSEFRRARELDEASESRSRRLYGRDYYLTLLITSNLARDMYGQGDYAAALRLQEEALPRHEASLGTTHPAVLFAKRTVAACYRKLGHTARARELAETNYLAYRNRLRDSHESTLGSMMTLTNALREAGDLNRAQEIAERALVLYQEHFPQHPFLSVCAVNLAIVYRQAGHVSRALQLNEAALANLSELLGVDHAFTLCCAANLANDKASLGDHAGALALSQETLNRSIRVRGEHHAYTLACANNHAIDLEEAGLGTESAGLRHRTLEQFCADPNLGEAHPDTVQAKDGKRIDCDIEPPPT